MSTAVQERPLVTFALFAYRQEKFICEAVEGAFAQTYSPIEIILSDDCSSDRTFEIMQEMAAAYRGPHKIILNRNPKNLGIGGHVNRVMELANGEWIVSAAGDDISLSNRVTEIESYWSSHGRFVGSIYSAVLVMDAESKTLYREGQAPPHYASLHAAVMDNCNGIHGASHAWHRDVFWKFGPFNDDLVSEDRAFGLRSLIVGEVHYLDQTLVRYRTHTDNCYSVRETRKVADITLQEIRTKYIKFLRMELNFQKQYLADLGKLGEIGNCSETERAHVAAAVHKRMNLVQSALEFEHRTYLGKICLAGRYLFNWELGLSRALRFMVRCFRF